MSECLERLVKGNTLVLILREISDAKSDVVEYTHALSAAVDDDDEGEKEMLMSLLSVANEQVCNAYDLLARYVLDGLVDEKTVRDLMSKEIINLVDSKSPYADRIIGNKSYESLNKFYKMLTEGD